jgi:hypothetical protein
MRREQQYYDWVKARWPSIAPDVKQFCASAGFNTYMNLKICIENKTKERQPLPDTKFRY